LSAPTDHNPASPGLRQVIDYAQIPAKPLVAAGTLMFLDAGASLLTPLVIGLTTAQILQQPRFEQLSLDHLLLIWAGLIMIQASLRYFSTQQLGRAAANVSARLRTRLYEHIQALPVSFFQGREHGDILSLLSEDIRRVSLFLTNTATEIAPHLITVLGATVIVLSIDPLTGIGALCVMPLVLATIRQAGRAASPLSRNLAERQAAHASLTEENLRLNTLVKAFTREQIEIARYESSNQKLLDTELQHLKISNRIAPMVQAITGLTVIILVWVGAYRIHSGTLQPAELVSLIMYGFILFRPLHTLGSSYGAYQSARGAASRLTELLQEKREPSASGRKQLFSPTKEIRFENVSLAYPGRAKVLDSLNLVIPAKRTTILIGENGSGKTSLVHLLLRFMDPAEGTIKIDDVDIQDFNLNELRNRIGYVPQNVTLINGTIEENIRYGVAIADKQSVNRAATIALVQEFACRLPEGLQTQVGPSGTKLSGGQKQRIALARALLKESDILILDEPTAMFDPDSEVKLLQNLLPQLQGKTVIVVTHRPAALKLADMKIELANGKASTLSAD